MLDLLLLDLDELLLKLLNDGLELLRLCLLFQIHLFQLRKFLLLFLELLFVDVKVKLIAILFLTSSHIKLLDLVKVLLQVLALLLEEQVLLRD